MRSRPFSGTSGARRIAGVLRPLDLAAAGAATVLAFALLSPLAARREREAGEPRISRHRKGLPRLSYWHGPCSSPVHRLCE